MKILYITSLFAIKSSSASIRNYGYINSLSEMYGAKNIDILTTKRPAYLYDDDILNNIKCNKIHYDEIKVIDKYFKFKKEYDIENKEYKNSKLFITIKKIIKDLKFFPSIEKEWIKNYSKLDYSKYDLIISSSDSKTSHLVARKIKNSYKKLKWIQIWGDPWSTDITLSKFNKFRAKFIEGNIIRESDLCIYVSEPTCNSMKDLYYEYKEKIKYIPRGYPQEVISDKKDINKKNIKAVYTGALNLGRDITALLKCIEEINDKSECYISLEIYGNIEDRYINILREKEFVNIKGNKSYFEILDIYKDSDILIYIGNEGDGTQIPGKLYDYFGTDKKVIAIVNKENRVIKKFIEDTNRAIVVENNEVEISRGLINILNNININDTPYNEFSSNSAIKKLLKYIKDI